MGTLRKAREEGKLEEFIGEREDQPPADQEAFEAVLNSMAGKSKSELETSPPECDDD
jgi:hypothetical protein